MEQGLKEIKLKHPIKIIVEINGIKERKEADTLYMTRFKTKHLKLLPSSFFKSIKSGTKNKKITNTVSLESIPELIPLFASLLCITEEECDEIDLEDLLVVAEVIGELLGK